VVSRNVNVKAVAGQCHADKERRKPVENVGISFTVFRYRYNLS